VHRDHTEGMRSRVYPTYKTKYPVANWPSYDRVIVAHALTETTVDDATTAIELDHME
jgi:hypothetical protein